MNLAAAGDPGAGTPSPDTTMVEERLRAIGAEIALCDRTLASYVTEGKLLRARLILLAAALGPGGAGATAARYATFLELVHAGALCHDDIVDRSCLRRDRPTIACAFGPRTAVLAGLFLMVRALELLADDPPVVRRVVARALRDVARGQVDELGDLYVEEVSPEAYLRRAYGKTGALYELGGWLGAHAGHLAATEVDALSRFAGDVGLAFQLADDVRDLLGGPSFGREAGTDLREGVYTLPLLLTLAGRCAGGETLRRLLDGRGGVARLGQCVRLLRANGALFATVQLARRRLENAVSALCTLPPSRARRALEEYALSMLAGVPIAHALAADDGGLGDGTASTADGRLPVVPTSPGLPVLAARGTDARLAAVVDGFQRDLDRDARADSRIEQAARVAATLMHLATDVHHGSGRSVWAANATLVGTIDLLVADLFVLLANASPAAVRSIATRLGALLRTAAAAAAETGA